MLGRPARRLREKTPPPPQTPTEFVTLPSEEGSSALRQVYLVTLPHPRQIHSSTGVPLVAPGSLSKEEVLRRFLHACTFPMYTDAAHLNGGPPVVLKRTGVWRELHKQDAEGVVPPQPHDHLPVLAERQFRYVPVKRALLNRHGLASHWSCKHTGYWSTIRYLTSPSPAKVRTALDANPVLWPLGNHPLLSECCHKPLTAEALRKRRRAAEDTAAEAGEDMPKVTEIDIWPIIVNKGFRNTPDSAIAHLQLIAYAKHHCSKEVQGFLFKHRHKLPTLIDDVWRWETAEDQLSTAQRSRVEMLHAAAAQTCICNGKWLEKVVEAFLQNAIPVHEVCRDIYQALANGRSESVPACVFAGKRGGEGKSLFLKALYSVFGHDFVFPTPQKGNFPLLDLPHKKVVFLDDWRFDEQVLSFATQCLWYDGSALPIVRPQNQPGVVGHMLYRGTAPIFATTKLDDLGRLQRFANEDPRRAPRSMRMHR